MSSLQPYLITSFSEGFQNDKKPFLLPDTAFQTLENAYTWRDRIVKRQGNKFLGRLRRVFVDADLGITGASPWTFTIYSQLATPISGEPQAQIVPGSVKIIIDDIPIITFQDQGDGTLLADVDPTNNFGTINYITGSVTLTLITTPAGTAATISFKYYPGLPVMGIPQREIANINNEQTIFFDTKYAYIHGGIDFQEWIPGTTWNGDDADFFWSTNYRGSTPESRLFFTTNDKVDSGSPMRYTDGATWTTFAPLVSTLNTLFQAKILIPYYGRLLALNVWEGTTAGSYASSVNIFNRCRFSQIGDPTAVDAWRSDIFGKGGFIDAPTNEAITGATFYKNTLIVFFERTTWQLRYVGQYGLPFLWERISSDFGSESTFSQIVFDQGVLAVGDKAIIRTESNTCQRIDEKIPDLVFDIRNAQQGPERVYGIRDFQRELVFWAFSDSQQQQKFPNKVLVYNYRNSTWQTFRDSVTAFGTFQPTTSITWDSLDIFWDDEDVLWDDVDTQSQFPVIVKGNAQGYVHYFGFVTQDEPSLTIQAVDMTVSANTLTSVNHNLENGDIIYLTGLMFSTPPTIDLNNRFFRVRFIDMDTIALTYWDFTANIYVDTPIGGATSYIGGGEITLFPRMNLQTKDFNPYIAQGIQPKLSYIDFLIDASGAFSDPAIVSIILNGNTDPANICNLLVGNNELLTSLTPPYYTPSSNISWFRFFATVSAQFFNITLTYDDGLMNIMTTHQQNFIFNAMTLYTRPGSRNVF